MEINGFQRDYEARYSPDIVMLQTARRMKPLEDPNESTSESSTSLLLARNIQSTNSSVPLGRKPSNQYLGKAKKDRIKTIPPANFNNYTYRRSRRIYNKVVTECTVPVPHIKNENEDPLARLKNTPGFRFGSLEHDSKGIFMACLGLQQKNRRSFSSLPIPICTVFTSIKHHDIPCKTDPLLSFNHANPLGDGRVVDNCVEIPFDDLLGYGYMVYPHDIICSRS